MRKEIIIQIRYIGTQIHIGASPKTLLIRAGCVHQTLYLGIDTSPLPSLEVCICI